MADRFFPNPMPRFPAEAPSDELVSSHSYSATLIPTELLSLPDAALFDRLRQTALNLKETVVRETWTLSGRHPQDYTLYTGALGTAFLALKSFLVFKNENDLKLCSEIVAACESLSKKSRHVTFICGRAGVCALGAVAAKFANDGMLVDHYLEKFKDIKLPSDLPNELLYGRAGFLWACLFLNKHIGRNTISNTFMRSVVDEVIEAGRRLGQKSKSPLMYEWHGKKYWGAAHGLAGIMHVLMDMELKPDEVEDVKNTLRYMIKNRFLSGNYPSSEESESDRLVHWCHGAPGVALTLGKAAEVFGDDEFLQAAIDAGEVVWNRGLLKRVGICHGISGNTYVFLSLYRLTGDLTYLHRAKAFACFLHQNAEKLISEGKMHSGDCPYSLFEGIGGMAYLFLDMVEPYAAKFPSYEL
ncbi:lanC-like protein GCL2 isoform X2 [Cucumis melo var. makuwa]|uniref:LanC-like protein GCL2 isoform X2 n=2 Tax=Cucumis melo TaxID=3656 RepID=A0A5A7V883_CUCMM|nr:lanC-like protein GCL2 isoform X2 [Cucumis melo var. makuwa]TYK20244.1 lanC-like protein GCL2 isoform X2 [Cucumis melo var. makuwa]